MTTSEVTNLAKEAIRLASTAGLGKDVIDLLTTKLDLLTQELAITKAQLSDAKSENTKLKTENEELKEQIQNIIPRPDRLKKKTVETLLHFFKEAGAISSERISELLGVEKSVADYHVDILKAEGFVRRYSMGVRVMGGYTPPKYIITDSGRAYVIEKDIGG